MANASPTQARSRLTDEPAQPMRAEAIAMRRIVVEMGYWLSPLLRDHPIPVLTEFERTADLSKLDRNTNAATKGRQREEQSKATLARIDRGGDLSNACCLVFLNLCSHVCSKVWISLDIFHHIVNVIL